MEIRRLFAGGVILVLLWRVTPLVSANPCAVFVVYGEPQDAIDWPHDLLYSAEGHAYEDIVGRPQKVEYVGHTVWQMKHGLFWSALPEQVESAYATAVPGDSDRSHEPCSSRALNDLAGRAGGLDVGCQSPVTEVGLITRQAV
jgi:hypothetical protein